MTVRGPIESRAMGITLPHEHLLLYHTPDDIVLSDPDVAAEELTAYARAGGKTLVELTNRGIQRDARGLRRIAEKTDVNIVMGCGYYKAQWHPAEMDEKTVETIAAEMVTDITEGVDGTGIRAGIIGEIGISSLTGNEEKVVIASAHAQQETGAAINVHFDIGAKESLRMRVLDILEREGVNLNRVITSHFQPRMDEIDYQERMAGRGTYVEYDLFGQETLRSPIIPTYQPESDVIRESIERGFWERILISQDVCFRQMLVRNGGWGYAHILNNVVPRFQANGMTDAEIQTILVEKSQTGSSFSVTSHGIAVSGFFIKTGTGVWRDAKEKNHHVDGQTQWAGDEGGADACHPAAAGKPSGDIS